MNPPMPEPGKLRADDGEPLEQRIVWEYGLWVLPFDA
jgi:hypothetical protein